MAETTAERVADKFPPVFWAANVTELFERAAYYSMASFVVIYLVQLGFGEYWPSNLNSLLWTIVYFLPILSGTIADVVGFRRSLLVAFVLLALGYSLMGLPVWAGWATIAATVGSEFTASPALMATMVPGILVIGLGGSVIKPCISSTIQKTAGIRATLGFAIFYMVINIGSLFGRGTAFLVRSGSPLPVIVGVVTVCALATFGLVYLVFRTTRVGNERSSIWPSTLGFIALVVMAAAVIVWV
jgi:proton-dependent oligopeptide transporter, POT family